ncbi:hypothetical protein FOMPIDRAFT_92487 [Fomitopsis schrenkii]|uniref:Uncharacterized protein n=1 Tax=Fomitopsis schrenkii TaxID=2126942 RepID=S8DQJ2_FOMSC|nr:hypothetical protein FOMPIDRAFT_92487 [Fomitopsis schrenkii]
MKLPAFYLLGAIIKIPQSLISSTQYTLALPGRPTAVRRSLAMHPSGVTSDSELSMLASGRNEVLPLHSSGSAICKQP